MSIAEMAHIFAAQDDGPRANSNLNEEERGDFSNLILLCANCHTLIDKAPDVFPDNLILSWKNVHQDWIAAVFGAVAYATRRDAYRALLALRAQTATVHRRIGPDNAYSWNPEADEAVEWQYHIRQTIIPVNRSILALLDCNHDLLNGDEPEVVEIFRQHIAGLEQRHIFGTPLPSAPLYPQGMEELFRT